MNISGEKTSTDWTELRKKLRTNINDQKSWEEAYQFFSHRLETRYFKPIEAIRADDSYQGEGFAITTILCSLIEFLEATYEGEVYRFVNNKNELNPHEYNESKSKFTSFLTTKSPFKDYFKDENLAKCFYKNVRCGLLHEASTKKNWLIRVDQEHLYTFEDDRHIINRDIFYSSVKEYLAHYKEELFKSIERKEAFIRKMNNISGQNIND